jgi:hypothetical protein
MKYKMIKCVVCNNPMPELRLTQYGYKNCVECSTIGAYSAVNTTNGTGDHTWNDIQIVSSQQAMDIKAAANIKPKWDNYEN